MKPETLISRIVAMYVGNKRTIKGMELKDFVITPIFVKIGDVNPKFTEIVAPSDKSDVNEVKEITPAVVTPVTPLITHPKTSHKTILGRYWNK